MMHKIPAIETEFLYGVEPKKEIYTNKDGKKEEVFVFEKDGDIIIDPNYNSLYSMGYHPVPDFNSPSPYNSIGCINNGFKDQMDICKRLFTVIRAMALYSFNKSHSGCYSVIGFKEAWLSKYYSIEFTYGCLKVYTDKDKKIDCINNARKRGVKIFPPDLNKSDIKISIMKENGKNVALMFGLADIKDAGSKACEIIIAEREANGDYTSIENFIDRLVSNRSDVVNEMLFKEDEGKYGTNPVNRKAINSLIKGGAFDNIEPNRFKLLNIYNGKINTEAFSNIQVDEYYNEIIDKKTGKVVTVKEKWKTYDESKYTRRMKLKYEFDKMGLYISEHPLDLENLPKVDFSKITNNEVVRFTGIIRKISDRTAKNKKKFTVLTVETNTSEEITVKLWSEVRVLYKALLKEKNMLVFTGKWNAYYTNIDCSKIDKIEIIGEKNNSDFNIDTMELSNSSIAEVKAPVMATPLPTDLSFVDDVIDFS